MFLKTLALAIIKGGKVIMPYLMGISVLTPTKADDKITQKVQDTLTTIGDLLVISQTFGESLKLEGPQKLEGIAPLVREVLLKAEFLHGKKVVAEDIFMEGTKDIVTGLSKILKSVEVD